ncbi:MAG: glycosyltransferase family 2 protein [Ignavibacteria bacterium]|nr:glycosyltransferase family 2 protein [Ignavibacteria bacterium]
MNEIRLSSIIIAKDEELNIKRCLNSLMGVIDDIVIIIDSRTTDNTFKLVSEYPGINCEILEWKGFAETKNYALTKTKHDWVLWIDADEELTEDLKSELTLFKKSVPQFTAYSVARRAFFLGKWIKHSGWYPSKVVRLFNKSSANFNNKSVHEGLVINGTIGSLKNDLNHFTDPTIKHYFSKFNNYTSLAANELFSKGKKTSLSDFLIRPLFLFVKMYIFRLGFLDGLHGLILALFSSFYVFTKYAKLWELNRNKK